MSSTLTRQDIQGVSKKKSFTKLGIADSWEEILMIFVANLQILNSVKLSFLDTLYQKVHS